MTYLSSPRSTTDVSTPPPPPDDEGSEAEEPVQHDPISEDEDAEDSGEDSVQAARG